MIRYGSEKKMRCTVGAYLDDVLAGKVEDPEGVADAE